MPRTGTTYNAPANSWNPAVNGAVISEVDWAATLADIAQALTDSLTRGETTAFTRTLLDDFGPVAARATLGVEPASTLLTNGGFDVWQASTSLAIPASTTATGSIYTADQWCMETSANQACTVSQQAGTGQARFRARVQRNSGQTGTTVLRFQQPLELWECIRLRGQTVTVNGTVRGGANFSGALRVKLLTGTGTEGRRTNAAAYTSEATPLDAALTVTASDGAFAATSTTIGTGITQAALVFEWTPSGTAGAEDWFELQDVAMQFGTTAWAYRRPDFPLTLMRCMRFYQPLGAGWIGAFANATDGAFSGNYLVPMRAAPTYGVLSGTFTFTEIGVVAHTITPTLAGSIRTPFGGEIQVGGFSGRTSQNVVTARENFFAADARL